MALKEEILRLLESRENDTFTPKQIAVLLGAKRTSVRVKLNYLVKTNKVHQIAKGVYQSPRGLIKQNIDPQIRFHGIKFEFNCNRRGTWSYLDLFKVVTEQLRTPWIKRHPSNRSIFTTTDWEGRVVNITLHPERVGLLEVWNKSSELPLHPLEFGGYCGYLHGVFKVPSDFWILRQIGINVDHERVQLDGWSNISMTVAQNNVLRMYQKAKDLRIETHITTKMTARECLSYMEGILRYAEILNKKE